MWPVDQEVQRSNPWLIRSDEGLTLETSALESLYVGQFTLPIISVDYTIVNNGQWL